MKKICGIYRIRNLVNWKAYIGSSNDIRQRWNRHIRELKGNYHLNPHLQNSWNKHGEENFTFEVLEEVKEKSLLEREQDYLNNEIQWDFDYNIARIADRPPSQLGKTGEMSPNFGRVLSREHRDKVSNSLLGNDRALGYKHNKETRQKGVDARTGVKRHKGSSSNYVGVCWQSGRSNWLASITLDKRYKYIGGFDSEILAAQNYDLVSMKYHNGKYPINFPHLKRKYKKLLKNGISKITEEII